MRIHDEWDCIVYAQMKCNTSYAQMSFNTWNICTKWFQHITCNAWQISRRKWHNTIHARIKFNTVYAQMTFNTWNICTKYRTIYHMKHKKNVWAPMTCNTYTHESMHTWHATHLVHTNHDMQHSAHTNYMQFSTHSNQWYNTIYARITWNTSTYASMHK